MARLTWRPAPKAKRAAKWFCFPAIVFAALLAGAIPAAAAETALSEAREGLDALEIVTANGTHEFAVEIMRTEPQRERGLMFRRFLPQDRGMLFIFEAERPIAMWMKNTYLPLDMVFIAKTGRVVGLAENAEPLSEKIIPSGAPAYGVLEVNAGAAAKIGLKIGDTVRHPAFAQ